MPLRLEPVLRLPGLPGRDLPELLQLALTKHLVSLLAIRVPSLIHPAKLPLELRPFPALVILPAMILPVRSPVLAFRRISMKPLEASLCFPRSVFGTVDAGDFVVYSHRCHNLCAGYPPVLNFKLMKKLIDAFRIEPFGQVCNV